jgi:hypothetical protein
MWKLTNVFTLEPTAQTTLVSNKISSWCAERAAKLNGEWSVLIGSFQVKVDDNKQWVQRHKQKLDTHEAIVELGLAFWECPSPMGFTYRKAQGKKFIINQTYVDHEVYESEGSYAYSSIMGGFLHLT